MQLADNQAHRRFGAPTWTTRHTDAMLQLPTVATPHFRIPPNAVPAEATRAALARFAAATAEAAGEADNAGPQAVDGRVIGGRGAADGQPPDGATTTHTEETQAAETQAAETQTAVDAVAALLSYGCDRDALADALRSGASHVVELTEDGTAAGDWLGAPALGRSFYLSLTTGTAMNVQPAALICDALAENGVLTGERRSPIELCLHEAVANGVMHGNLGVSSKMKEEPEGYRLFSRTLTERLRDPLLRRRRLDVYARWNDEELTVSVADEGDGFDAGGLRLKPEGRARSGRGFLFMRALADGLSIGDGGRCTTLRFDL